MSDKCYFAFNTNEEVRKNSTSGGIFYLVSKLVIENGGTVFASRFDKDFNVIYDSFDSLEDIKYFQGSKYVNSQIGESYKKAEALLNENILVLFVGTPCQVAGLLKYLKKQYSNLLTMDFICHSNAPSYIWRNYLDNYWDVEKIEDIKFKDKSKGWKNFNFKITFKDGTQFVENGRKNLYMTGYLNATYALESCFSCKFKGISRCCDITIGDAWGIDKICPEIFDNKGASAIITHTQRANEILSEIKNDLVIKEISAEDLIKYNTSVVNVAKKGPLYDDFKKKYKKTNFKKLMEFFCSDKKSIRKSIYYRKLKFKNIWR